MQRLKLAGCCLSLTLSAVAPAANQAPPRKTQAEDAVVTEVVRMLEAGVEERLILRWLDREGQFPSELSANDVIALTQAEASTDLVDRLLATPAARPAARRETAAATAPTADGLPLRLAVRYRPFRDPEADDDEQWHLFVYIDGLPYSWSDGKQWLSKSKRNRDVDLRLSPGPHVLRLTQERHVKRSRGWRHEARACPELIAFEQAGDGGQLDIEVKQPSGLGFGTKGSYRWTLWQGGQVADEGPLSGPPHDWTPLCEEIESNYAEGDKIPRRVQKQLAGCARWTDLWEGVAGAPERGTVRSQLERFDFRPVIATD